jgi:peptidoglycan/xylan/chitin deacetylase (PgdA/CDA1 family)
MNSSNQISVVMYHYVREISKSLYPRIKGLEFQDFQNQILYFKKNYNIISVEEMLGFLNHGDSLPPKSLILTFDDGYADHYDYVFKFLNKEKLPGAFYLPAQAIAERKMLDVNKIHFILACSNDLHGLVRCLCQSIDKYSADYNLTETSESYFQRLAFPSRFDSKEVVFIKLMLQKELPELLRAKICDELFSDIVKLDQIEFADLLYMSIDQVKTMRSEGMHIGHHGFDHVKLAYTPIDQVENDIFLGLKFLKTLGIDENYWTMCYPYGSYNIQVMDLLKKYGCQAAFCTEVDVADFKTDIRFKIPRLDTNDLPKIKSQQPTDSRWYKKVESNN